MRKVQRDDLVDYASYEARRAQLLAQVNHDTQAREVRLSSEIIVLFQTTAMVAYQVQETVWCEGLTRESDIQHELDTYNALLADVGQLACSVVVVTGERERTSSSYEHDLALLGALYAKLEDGTIVPATWDEGHAGSDRSCSVHYVKFEVSGRCPVALGCDSDRLRVELELNTQLRETLTLDLQN